MSFAKLMGECRKLGVIMAAKDGSLSIKAPKGVITTELLYLLKQYKPVLLACLPVMDQGAMEEWYVERAAIMEYDGGLSREAAEDKALIQLEQQGDQLAPLETVDPLDPLDPLTRHY